MEKNQQVLEKGWRVLVQPITGQCKIFQLKGIGNNWVSVTDEFLTKLEAQQWIHNNAILIQDVYYLDHTQYDLRSDELRTEVPHVADLSICQNYNGERLSSDPGWNEFIGECAAGVQYVCYKSGDRIAETVHWKEGERVKGGGTPPGTAIASFRNGVYANDHAAIFIRELPGGIEVWDQFNNPQKPWGIRTLLFKAGDSDYSNDGDLFSVILA